MRGLASLASLVASGSLLLLSSGADGSVDGGGDSDGDENSSEESKPSRGCGFGKTADISASLESWGGKSASSTGGGCDCASGGEGIVLSPGTALKAAPRVPTMVTWGASAAATVAAAALTVSTEAGPSMAACAASGDVCDVEILVGMVGIGETFVTRNSSSSLQESASECAAGCSKCVAAELFRFLRQREEGMDPPGSLE